MALCAFVAIALLAGASPAVADPAGSQFRITTQGMDGDSRYYAQKPDMAYDPVTDQHLVVFVNVVWDESIGDVYTIEGQFIDASGNTVGDMFAISPAGVMDWEQPPSVAYNATDDEFLVAWYQYDAGVYAQRVASDGALLGSTIDVSTTDYDDIETVDIAWSGDADEYLVAWKDNDSTGQVFGRVIAADGTPQGTDQLQISHIASGRGADDAMAVAYNTVDQEFLVVWRGTDPTQTGYQEYEIWGQRVDLDGSGVGPSDFRISHHGVDSYLGGVHALRPDIAFDPGRDQYLVVYISEPTQGESTTEVFGQLVAADGAMIGSTFQISDLGRIAPGSLVNGPDVAYDEGADLYLVVYSRNPGRHRHENDEIYGTYVTGTGALTDNRDFQISQMNDPPTEYNWYGLRPSVDLNTTSDEFMTTWWGSTYTVGPGVQDEIWGRAVSTTPAADTTEPATTIELNPASPNGAGWYKSLDVYVVGRDNSGGSNVAQTRCDVLAQGDPAPESFDDLPDADCDLTSITTDGRWTIYAASKDNAGNVESQVASTDVAVDGTAPSLAAAISPGSDLLLNQPASASPNATDNLSGIASETCGAVNTSAVGSFGVGCSATDNAGNTDSSSVPYQVRYKVGFDSPTAGASVKPGKPVTISVWVGDYDSTRISDTDAAAMVAAGRVTIEGAGAQWWDAVPMKYDKRSDTFAYRWHVGRSGSGAVTLRAWVTYAFTSVASSATRSVTITGAQ